MTTLFISDLHLQEERPDITRAFYRFLDEKVQPQDTLYILGDFFEVWVGDDLMTDFQREVAEKLGTLKEKQVTTYFMHGNRDFLVGQKFCDIAEATLLPDPHPVRLGLTHALLSHGDVWCTSDEKYQQYRRVVHNPLVQWFFLKLPKRIRQNIGAKLRSQSKSRDISDYSILDVTIDTIEQVMIEKNVPLIIHGHTHRPQRHPMPEIAQALQCSNAERIVLGDWDKKGWFLSYDKGQLVLVDFDINQ
ncbi:UDP-2,3-diacylglucosamine diphosphatase [Litoribacillus peritrichatus]|uniref:UDP-2,3-diacylglucosamine hydrolase n=1 Tax=Litoribacillus peritrichatus TaxID=718191 RepID=A0ABP7M763_9GAMM